MTVHLTPVEKTLIQALILALILAAPILFAQSGAGQEHLPANPQAPGSDRISAASLDKVKSGSQYGFTESQTSQWTANPPAGVIENYDIYKNSVILQHGDIHTLLPPHSVIFIPESLKSKISTEAKGDFVTWPEFYIRNRHWIFTHQISLKQAAGDMPINPNALEQFQKINRIVIAIYQQGPISVLPAKISK